MLILWRTLKKGQLYEVYNHYLHYSILCLLVQEQQLCLHWCSSILGMDLKLLLHRTKTKSGNRSLVIWSSFKRLFFDLLAIYNVSFTPLYKGVKARRIARLKQQFTSAKTLLKLFYIKVHLEFLNNFHILEILESVSGLYCEHHWLYIKCSTSNKFLFNSVWIEASCSCAWA